MAITSLLICKTRVYQSHSPSSPQHYLCIVLSEQTWYTAVQGSLGGTFCRREVCA